MYLGSGILSLRVAMETLYIHKLYIIRADHTGPYLELHKAHVTVCVKNECPMSISTTSLKRKIGG